MVTEGAWWHVPHDSDIGYKAKMEEGATQLPMKPSGSDGSRGRPEGVTMEKGAMSDDSGRGCLPMVVAPRKL